MQIHKLKIVGVLALCLGMVFSSMSVLAQNGAGSAKSAAAVAQKVNLNSATADQLESLPGIGPSMAKSIIDHRNKVGKFNRVEELMNIKGIGEKKFLKIKDRLTV